MVKTEFCVPSSDGIHTLQGRVYLPDTKPRGFFHIVHGMTEHIGRYDRFMTDMAKAGYICFGFDNLGHGYTAGTKELGFIAERKGYDLLARDVERFSGAVIKKYGAEDETLPYYLMGHSMGSFITRFAVSKYVKPKKFIFMGTGGKNPAADAGLLIIAFIKLLFGKRHISPLVDKLAFGSYNKRFGGGTENDPSPWLTNDGEERKKYYADPFCTFKFTVSAMGDLIRLNKLTNSKKWYKEMPKDLPVLLVSGEDDPVGDYGKGVLQVAVGLQKCGIDAKCILYPNTRHEILNDSTYDTVKNDILKFLNM